MSKVEIISGDLFSAEKGSVLAHACNAQGVWGSGIAKIFADKFPEARKVYTEHCRSSGRDVLGTCLIIPAGDYKIACLFTSENFGDDKDAPKLILERTRSAVADLLRQTSATDRIAMCKINSGLFAVPWDKTKAVLDEFCRAMIVYDL